MDLLTAITDFYLNSDDFNGVPLWALFQEIKDETAIIKSQLADMVRAGQVSNFGDLHPNAHIKSFEPEPAEEQIEKLAAMDDGNAYHVCVYPERPVLEDRVDRATYEGKPFSLRLALGEPQLTFEKFDLSVLEIYRNDPRYYYVSNDIDGKVSIRDQFYLSEEMPESDKALLQAFGFCYDKDFNRAVAVFLRYLNDLTPQHQRIWEAKVVKGEYYLHPDYLRTSMGEWPERISLFEAFLMELRHINEMCELMEKPGLFRTAPDEWEKPRGFGFLLRPTLKEFQDFVSLLDKLLSDNLNKRFFEGDLETSEDVERADGKVEVRQKGTIRLLEEWLTERVRLSDPRPATELIESFREVRKLRQRPAHALDDDHFDQAIFKQQRELMIRACVAVRTIRQILANHPKVQGYKVSDDLFRGAIWTF